MNRQDIDIGPAPSYLRSSAFATAMLAIFVIYSSFHIVPPGHRGISVILGNVNPEAFSEGVTFKWPLIQKIIDIPIMQIKADGKAESFSSDLQNLSISFAIMYRIPADKVVTLFQGYKGDPYTSLIEPRAQESTKQITAAHRAEEIVKSRDKIKEQIVAKLKEAVGDLIIISDVTITNIDISTQLEQAIEQKVVREQEALAKSFELEKEKRQAEITFVQAEAEAKAIKIKGDALKVSPEAISFEIARKWDGRAPLAVTSSGASGTGVNILLPIGQH
jgi:regulator of protease activity HflC (stomatin/prohibitin superfamily)